MHQKEVQNSVSGEAMTKIIYFEMTLGYVSTISSSFKGSTILTINMIVLKKLLHPELFLTISRSIVAYFLCPRKRFSYSTSRLRHCRKGFGPEIKDFGFVSPAITVRLGALTWQKFQLL